MVKFCVMTGCGEKLSTDNVNNSKGAILVPEMGWKWGGQSIYREM